MRAPSHRLILSIFLSCGLASWIPFKHAHVHAHAYTYPDPPSLPISKQTESQSDSYAVDLTLPNPYVCSSSRHANLFFKRQDQNQNENDNENGNGDEDEDESTMGDLNSTIRISVPRDELYGFLMGIRDGELLMLARTEALLVEYGFDIPGDDVPGHDDEEVAVETSTETLMAVPTPVSNSAETAVTAMATQMRMSMGASVSVDDHTHTKTLPGEQVKMIETVEMTTTVTITTTTSTYTTVVRTRSAVADMSTAMSIGLVDTETMNAESTTWGGSSPSTSLLSSPTPPSSHAAELNETVSPFAVSPGHTNSSYTFNAASSSNIAVYFGQSPATSSSSLLAQCASPSIDIVILAFMTSSSTSGSSYPTINFGAACNFNQTAEMAAQAPGLLYCPELGSQITQCQEQYGKKVLLSMGGSTGRVEFSSDEEGEQFADTLWGLFGPSGSGSVETGLRPFGNAVVDGFDVDNETDNPTGLTAFATRMRSHFSSSSTKTYYLSSAPQCPYPDASNPQGLLLLCDFVWVQFYNNPSCEIGSPGFKASVKQWSSALDASELQAKTRLYVGAPAWSQAGASAYEGGIGSPEGVDGLVRDMIGLQIENLGGFMFWDGSEAGLNVENGKDIITYAKEGLTGQ